MTFSRDDDAHIGYRFGENRLLQVLLAATAAFRRLFGREPWTLLQWMP
jgi:hypothetical protein